MEILMIMPIALTVIGWMVIYAIAKKNSERAEIRGLVTRAIDILVELEKESTNIWILSNSNSSSNRHIVAKIVSQCGWFEQYVNILDNYIAIDEFPYEDLQNICTEGIEHIQKLDALKIEARIFRISNNMLTIKYQLEKSFIDKYHNKNLKNSLS